MEFVHQKNLGRSSAASGPCEGGHLAPADNTHIAEHDWTGVARRYKTTSGSLTSRLRHIYWIGGSSGAGKSTIARRWPTSMAFGCVRWTREIDYGTHMCCLGNVA
jgi:hypothetical protein